jgi:uncharacterized LabA/DUF88 family protein
MTPLTSGSGASPKPLESVMIFIDGGYLRKLFKDLFGRDDIDFTRVSRYLIKLYNGYPQNMFRANLIRTYYYDGLPDSEKDSDGFLKQKTYIEDIKRLNFNVSVALGEAVKEADGRFRQKGVDVLLAIDALSMAYENQYQSGLFLLGDRDFIPLLEAVKMTGKKVYGFFYIENVSRELSHTFDFRSAFNKEIMETWLRKESRSQ